jgi:hypothetical protein
MHAFTFTPKSRLYTSYCLLISMCMIHHQEGALSSDHCHGRVGEDGGEARYRGQGCHQRPGHHDGGEDGILGAGPGDGVLPPGDRHQGGGCRRPARQDAQTEDPRWNPNSKAIIPSPHIEVDAADLHVKMLKQRIHNGTPTVKP